jgi:hypothetical protein
MQLLTKISSDYDFVNDYQYDYLNRMTQVTQQGNGGDAVALKGATVGTDFLNLCGSAVKSFRVLAVIA